MTHVDASDTRAAYADVAATFSLTDAQAWFSGSFTEGINACVECVDRHPAEAIALRCLSPQLQLRQYSFGELQALSARAANVMRAHGIGAGDVVAGLLPRTVGLVATILGAWRLGAIYQPLFTAFGPKAIEQRLQTSQAKLVVTDPSNRAKLDEVPHCPRIAVDTADATALHDGDLDYRQALAAAEPVCEPVMRRGEDLFMLLSTSGTTGLPKGVPVPLRAMAAFSAYMRYGIELRDDDVFWNLADPGWAYGLYYAVFGPLSLGRTTTLHEGSFSVEGTFAIIEQLGVTNLAGSPTAFRALIAAAGAAPLRLRGQLRAVSSAGEPLNPEVIRWFHEQLDVQINDHYGQTEMGMCVNNHHGLRHAIRPGSAGFAMPGYRVAVRDDAGNVLGPNQPGTLCIDLQASPLMWFSGYHRRAPDEVSGRYYATGDTVELEEDGAISFVGRADDVITSSGYRIGPFDVESALLEHPAVYEAAVVGVPDPERTEVVKAFIVLKQGHAGSAELAEALQHLVRRRLSAHAYPRQVEFIAALPKTPSGKIQRFVLRGSCR